MRTSDGELLRLPGATVVSASEQQCADLRYKDHEERRPPRSRRRTATASHDLAHLQFVTLAVAEIFTAAGGVIVPTTLEIHLLQELLTLGYPPTVAILNIGEAGMVTIHARSFRGSGHQATGRLELQKGSAVPSLTSSAFGQPNPWFAPRVRRTIRTASAAIQRSNSLTTKRHYV